MDDAKETMCEVHAGQRVIANCSLCQRPVCNKCLGERKGTRLLCRDCAVKDIVASYDGERQKETEEAEVAEVKKHVHVEKRRKVLRIAMASALVIEAVALFFLAGRVARAHQWLVGGVDKAYAKSLQTDRCVANLWKIKAALDKFIHENKRPPATLSELLDNGLRKIPVCPVSHREYLYEQVREGVYVFRCPTPQEHAAGELRCDTTGAAPQALP